MRDVYTESIVPISPKFGFKILKYGLTILTAISLIVTVYLSFLFTVFVVAFGILLYKVMQHTDGEYEYVHTNDCFDVDLVVANSRRKHLISVNLNQVVLVAKTDSEEGARYMEISGKDYTGNCALGTTYMMVYKDTGGQKKLLLQLDTKMYQSLKQWMPGKVQ